MKDEKKITDALLVQRHQQLASQKRIGEIHSGIKGLKKIRSENLDKIDNLEAEIDAMLSAEGIIFDETLHIDEAEIDSLTKVDEEKIYLENKLSTLDSVDGNINEWDSYISSIRDYAKRNDVDLDVDPFQALMTESQRIDINKRVQDELTYKKANCDKYDYMLAGTCGMIAGLIDIIFVGIPKQGLLGKKADEAVDGAVQKFAKVLGWKGPKADRDPMASAIDFLENKFKVNYDQTHTNKSGKMGTDGLVKNMYPRNHHLKSLAHSPDLIGLFFSILDQFNNTSTFVSDGKLITIDTETFELNGSNFIAKIFAGFCNWFGHLLSDIAGSSGARGNNSRGSGIPMPFYSLLQFVEVGEFGKHRDSFAKVSVKVFEEGYDFRHGLALAIPVLISELLTRVCWSFKQRLYHRQDWKNCVPSAAVPELRRMLLVSHGTLCLVDGADAGLRSGGNMVQFMLRANVIAWARFGTVAAKEVISLYRAGSLDLEAANEYLDKEYERMLGIRDD
ncbi:hypothetical protein [Halomonas alkaliantarctica]|uniref:hypothetical protein n=1 Tax=Halomonas alkaliantarctica TaxID=232346 RepID=UPI002657F19B|nr:hypothetical protein [Halomonas alkaliantarctica]